MKDNKIVKIVFVFSFFSIIVFFMVTTLFNNEKVSDLERRNLETFPEFSFKALTSKEFYDDLTTAFNDQLELRNVLIKGYFLFQFQRYYGDAVIGDNNQLYSPSQTIPSSSYYNNLEKAILKVNEVFDDINAKFIFLSIPRKDAYMTKDLPNTYNSSLDIYERQVNIVKNTLSNDIIFIDAYDVFASNDIYNCYYSNDHHITPRCAYLLYEEINKYTNTESYDLDEMFYVEKTIVNGAYNRQLGQSVKSSLEELYLIPKQEIKYTRYENDELSDKEVYGVGNSYEDAYMGGDMAYTRIETNNDGKNIMFVGSSFTNILEALAIPSYNTMVSVDYRHNDTGNGIDYYVNKYDIDYVVFIPAQSNNAFSIERINLYLGK